MGSNSSYIKHSSVSSTDAVEFSQFTGGNIQNGNDDESKWLTQENQDNSKTS
jgi:hypothetical protein